MSVHEKNVEYIFKMQIPGSHPCRLLGLEADHVGSEGKICLSTENRKGKGPEAGKSAPGTMNEVSKR